MTTRDSYPGQSDEVPSDLSGVWQDLVPPLGEGGAEDVGSRSLTSGAELKNYTKESASAAIERIFNGFRNGDINPYNLNNAISDVLGTQIDIILSSKTAVTQLTVTPAKSILVFTQKLA